MKKPAITAWEALRSLNQLYGAQQVAGEIYQWFCADAGTISYSHTGLMHLLTKPEEEALKIIYNALLHLSEDDEAVDWREFVKKKETPNQK